MERIVCSLGLNIFLITELRCIEHTDGYNLRTYAILPLSRLECKIFITHLILNYIAICLEATSTRINRHTCTVHQVWERNETCLSQ